MRGDRDPGGHADTSRPGIRRISVIAPMLNEEAHIEQFVADVASQDFTGELELIVADGGSEDRSVQHLEQAAEKARLDYTVLENPARRIAPGLNVCLRKATGDLIVRLDCHSRYPPDYVSRCAAASEETGAWTVGGIIVAHGRTAMERAVACAMDSPFGGIGSYRVLSTEGGLLRRLAGAFGISLAGDERAGSRVEVDTLTYGAFRPIAFERAGFFDESLKVDEDEEFNLRVRRAGGKVVLDPSIRVHYVPRGSWPAVFRQYYEYGRWKVPVLVKHRQLPNPRAAAPIVFFTSLMVLVPRAAWSSRVRLVVAGELGFYAAAALAVGTAAVRRRREPLRLLPRVLAVFPAFHAGYGLGMLAGALHALRGS